MFPSRHRLLPASALLCCVLLGSCAAVPKKARNPELERASALIKSTSLASIDSERFLVANLQAAEIASVEEAKSPSTQAQAISDAATVAAARWAVANNLTTGKRRVSSNGVTYELSLPAAHGTIPASAFESLKPASKVPRTLLKTWEARPGTGVPVAAQWKRPENPLQAEFVSARGYLAPVTAWLTFPDGTNAGAVRKARLEFLDPTIVQKVTEDGRTVPLAADISASVVDRTVDIREVLIALEGLIHPGVTDARLVMLQPYDPARIPVVFVHGLMSHPRMWRDVVNELMADPKISARYQFWVYYYPTGWPIAYSALRLREELAAVDKAVGKQKKIVLVGHSMGGLLSRMQAISPGEKLAKAMIPESRWAKFQKLPPDQLVKRTMEFQANPSVERIIFISTPHRGSGLADWSLTTWFTKFVRLPTTITSSAIDLLPSLMKSPEQYTSISRLSPSNPLYPLLETIPMTAPHHSIIGDRGRGDTPNSSDGVVPYWSSHLDSAESEVIVPDDHGSFDDPAAIAEMKRILIKNLSAR
ncbi:MAG: esterase/lipase family protein [Terrimicrobiaceae bacterium]